MEEGRFGEAAQHGAFGIVEKGDLERSEKEELRGGAEAIRRTRTLERQVRRQEGQARSLQRHV